MNIARGEKGKIMGAFAIIGVAMLPNQDLPGFFSVVLPYQNIYVTAGAHPGLRIVFADHRALQRQERDLCALQRIAELLILLTQALVPVDRGKDALFYIRLIVGYQLAFLQLQHHKMGNIVLGGDLQQGPQHFSSVTASLRFCQLRPTDRRTQQCEQY